MAAEPLRAVRLESHLALGNRGSVSLRFGLEILRKYIVPKVKVISSIIENCCIFLAGR